MDEEVTDVDAHRSLRFAPDVAVLASVRDFADAAADQLGATVDRADLAVIVGELAANAAIHQDCEAELTVRRRADGGLLVEVSDGDQAQPRMVDGEVSGMRGHRGMFLVDVLSEAWGVEPSWTGKRVWALVPPASRRFDPHAAAAAPEAEQASSPVSSRRSAPHG